jgi:hypothetical protein
MVIKPELEMFEDTNKPYYLATDNLDNQEQAEYCLEDKVKEGLITRLKAGLKFGEIDFGNKPSCIWIYEIKLIGKVE